MLRNEHKGFRSVSQRNIQKYKSMKIKMYFYQAYY